MRAETSDPAAWPFATSMLPVSDGAVSVVDEGNGVPLLFVHGTPTWSYEWRHALRALSTSRRVIAFDHLGFGRSERPLDASYTPEAHAARFREAIALLVPSGPLDLVVHDFGGPIALDWALDHASRVRHLVIVNTWMWPFDDDPLMSKRARMASGAIGRLLYRYANASLKLIMPSAYGDKRKLTAAIHGEYLRPFPDADSREQVLFALAKSLLGSSAFYGTLWNRRERLREVPITIAWGVKDSAFTLPVLNRWVQSFPHAHVHRFVAAGHWPHEEAPEEFVALLKARLE